VSAPAAATAAAARGLGRRALFLGAANAFDYAVQFLLPVVLVRCLDTEAFGQYRLLWLALGTVMATATLAMPASLYYYLPRSEPATRRVYVNQTLVFLVLAGAISAWAVSAWNPWLPDKMRLLTQHGLVVPAFVLLWVVASLLDLLPTIEERVLWQGKATVGLAALRGATLSAVAALTHDVAAVLLVLVAFVLFKLAVLLAYIAKYHGLRGPWLHRAAFVDQLRYATPFGTAGALYELRVQADQWIAAALFSLGSFAAFSIAGSLGPLVHLFRKSVNYAFLSSMSRLQAAGDIRGMIDLNSRANVMVGALIIPLLAFAFVFARELVTLVYTAAYVEAVPVMRLYITGLAALVVELASITFLLRQGMFVIRLNLAALAVAVALSWIAARQFGLAGAAAGGVAVIYLDRIATLWRISRRTGVAVRNLQNWRTLALLALSAACAAAFAWSLVGRYLPGSAALARMSVGAVLLGTAYAAMVALLLPRRALARAALGNR
jgi:O-antigen/teichoic acid export membrane protein